MEKNEDEKQVQVGDLTSQEDNYLGVNVLKLWSGRPRPGVVQDLSLFCLSLGPLPPRFCTV